MMLLQLFCKKKKNSFHRSKIHSFLKFCKLEKNSSLIGSLKKKMFIYVNGMALHLSSNKLGKKGKGGGDKFRIKKLKTANLFNTASIY